MEKYRQHVQELHTEPKDGEILGSSLHAEANGNDLNIAASSNAPEVQMKDIRKSFNRNQTQRQARSDIKRGDGKSDRYNSGLMYFKDVAEKNSIEKEKKNKENFFFLLIYFLCQQFPFKALKVFLSPVKG